MRLRWRCDAAGTAQRSWYVASVATAENILTQALKLPSQDRARVAAVLLASLDDGEDDDADRAWAAEIEQRAERVLSGGSRGSPWPEVRARLLARLNRG